MTNLTQLRLELIDANFYPAFLLALRLPVLEDLWIHQATSSLPSLSWDVGFYSTWFARTKRASKSLKRLNLSDSQLGPTMHGRLLRSATSYSVLQKLLKNFSQLHSLSLATGICVHLPILDLIANGQLLPQLQVLHLATASDPHVILEMVRTRNTGPSSKEWECIKSLMLTLPDAFSDREDELEEEAALLGLDKGLLMHFVPPCTIQGCASMCCFGV
ncbi:hypothetical protein CPB84DRAFT_1802177 [Gymnopilus junonius]|uniref:Uncharacterized protein n=1 Tax=Gymnopilus junonius TaxID=109634 RepID=A0A9P5N958_GYMJU|nr:hypothetical protein CPB84DRAFT_1802177 [Gymnopilus junonius]